MARVLVVEDEPAVGELIALNLRHAGHDVQVVARAEHAVEEIRQRLPDLIVLDWLLPGEPGLSLCRRWRNDARTKHVPIIMLTARCEEQDRVTGLDAGADDYMPKPFSTNELLARVRAVIRRRLPEALEAPVQFGELRLDPATYRAFGGSQEVRLGGTEFRLLRYLMCHPERVHSRAQLLDRVWGDHVFIEERTVDVHIKRLRDALAPTGCSMMVETVRGVGYRMTRQPQATSVNASRELR